MRISCVVLIGLSSLLLLAYPFALVADIMSFAGAPSATPHPFVTAAVTAFLWGSSLYPIPYLTCLVASILHLRKDRAKKALFWQAGLQVYILVIGCLFAVGFLFSTN